MISYEIRTGAISIRQPPSGCRTWLRLHRALQFVTMFFYRLASVDFKEKMTSLAQDCYEQTLAKYHGYLIRKVRIHTVQFFNMTAFSFNSPDLQVLLSS